MSRAFKEGQVHGTFGQLPKRPDSTDYMSGWETGRRFREDMIAQGAKLKGQQPLLVPHK